MGEVDVVRYGGLWASLPEQRADAVLLENRIRQVTCGSSWVMRHASTR